MASSLISPASSRIFLISFAVAAFPILDRSSGFRSHFLNLFNDLLHFFIRKGCCFFQNFCKQYLLDILSFRFCLRYNFFNFFFTSFPDSLLQIFQFINFQLPFRCLCNQCFDLFFEILNLSSPCQQFVFQKSLQLFLGSVF